MCARALGCGWTAATSPLCRRTASRHPERPAPRPRSVRDRLIESYNDTNAYHEQLQAKRVSYLSLEFLIGRSMQVRGWAGAAAGGICMGRGVAGRGRTDSGDCIYRLTN